MATHQTLPDDLAEIEAGKPQKQAEPLDHSREGRLRHYLGRFPG